MAKLIVNGQVVEQFFDASLSQYAVAQIVTENFGEDSTFSVELTVDEALQKSRQAVRTNLEQQVADSESILGTTSDTVHLLLNELSGFVNKLSAAQSLAEMRSSTTSLKAAIGDIETQVANGSLSFPYQTKGQSDVMNDIIARANGVDAVIKAQ
ncbi:hypothetical protein [Pseudoalteromonas luteoviolacea]|uniref:Uncharacterized protein n=1 Tax=Pseudoalteromonas luteoviolacea S4060-1 TaxID=1365257 RepID=A0A162CEX1_9GAMM|nr:hypothetical protein [Pseudoalteromonas luteoviolacea]KZN66826.1 hypothetical protein N478_18495 [Pseudoalteromonas luteoviolacea S4060-1]